MTPQAHRRGLGLTGSRWRWRWRRPVWWAPLLLCAWHAVASDADAGGAGGAGRDRAAPPADLARLMHLLSARRHGQVDFVEQHFLRVLKRPVESSGIMTYDAPRRLEKRTFEPRPERMVIDGDELTLERKGRTHVLELSAYPSLVPLIEGLRATLAGDLPALEHDFDVEFDGTLDRWSLTLSPRDADVARTVPTVRLEGAREALSRVAMVEANGDHSLMTLRDHRSAP